MSRALIKFPFTFIMRNRKGEMWGINKLNIFVSINSFQVVVSNDLMVFGSASKLLRVDQCWTYNYGQQTSTIYINKVHMKALNQPSQPCAASKTADEVNTDACISTFIGKLVYIS